MSVDDPVARCPQGHANLLGSAFCSTCGQGLGVVLADTPWAPTPSSSGAPTAPPAPVATPVDGDQPWYQGATGDPSSPGAASPVLPSDAPTGVTAGGYASFPPISPPTPPSQAPHDGFPQQAGYPHQAVVPSQAGFPPPVGYSQQARYPAATTVPPVAAAQAGRSSASGLPRVITVVGAFAAIAGPFIVMVLRATTPGLDSSSRFWVWGLVGPTDWILRIVGPYDAPIEVRTVWVGLEPFGAIGYLLAIIAGILALVGARSGGVLSLVSGGVLLLLAAGTAIRIVVDVGSGIEVLWDGPWQSSVLVLLTIELIVPGLLLVVGGIGGLMSQRSRAPYGSLA